MPIREFPPHELADENGILAVGGDLHPESLLLAYRSGIFPWPMEGAPLLWFSPPERGIVFFSDLHIPKSLEKARRKSTFRITHDQAFEKVIRECADVPRPGQSGTWITEPMLEAYVRLHELGHAHSFEVWDGEDLVGGIYGVDADGAFAAESMFYDQPYASKIALLALIDHMKSRGATWLDIQVMTPHMEKLGARLIEREQFHRLLSETRKQGLILFPQAAQGST